MRRVATAGNMIESLLRKAHEGMLLRERSSEWRDVEKWKSAMVSLSPLTVLMLFPRSDRCSRVEYSARLRISDKEEKSLFSRTSLVMWPDSGREIVESWLPEAVSDLRAGNRDATSTIWIHNVSCGSVRGKILPTPYLVPT